VERTGEEQLALLESSFETGDELTAKDTTKYAHGQKEGIAGMDPMHMVRGKTSGGDYTMDMRMKKQVLPPTVQHGEKADLGPEVFGVGGDLQQGLRAGVEQEVIEDFLVYQCQVRELVRQSEDHMDIGNR
jgi:hypothetical protein